MFHTTRSMSRSCQVSCSWALEVSRSQMPSKDCMGHYLGTRQHAAKRATSHGSFRDLSTVFTVISSNDTGLFFPDIYQISRNIPTYLVYKLVLGYFQTTATERHADTAPRLPYYRENRNNCPLLIDKLSVFSSLQSYVNILS